MATSLSPQNAIGFGFGASALVWSMYQTHMPTVANVRVSPQMDKALDAQRKVALVESAAIAVGAWLLTKSSTVFVMAGFTALALDIAYRHADAVDNQTNKVPNVTQDQGTAPASS